MQDQIPTQDQIDQARAAIGIPNTPTGSSNPSGSLKGIDAINNAWGDTSSPESSNPVSSILGGIKNTATDYKNAVPNFMNEAGRNDSSTSQNAIVRTGENALGATASGLGTVFSPVNNMIVKPLSDAFSSSKIGQDIASTPVVGKVLDFFNKLSTDHPEAARNISNALTVGLSSVGETKLPEISSDVGGKIGEMAQGATNAVGDAAGKVAGVAGDITGGVGNAIKGVGNVAGESILGTKELNAAKTALTNPSTEQYYSGSKDLSGLSKEIQTTADNFNKKGKADLQAIKDAIPEDAPKIQKVDKLNQYNELIKKTFGIEDRKPGSIGIDLSKTGAGDQETRLINNLNEKVFADLYSKESHPRDLLNLRESIDKSGFYKDSPEYSNSNKFVSGVRKMLNTMAAQGNPDLTAALEKSAKQINLLERIKYNLLGDSSVNVKASENRLGTLLNRIKDPSMLKGGETTKLLEEWKKATGQDLLKELKGASAAHELTRPLSSSASTLQTVRNVAKRGVGKAMVEIGKRVNK